MKLLNILQVATPDKGFMNQLPQLLIAVGIAAGAFLILGTIMIVFYKRNYYKIHGKQGKTKQKKRNKNN